MMETVHLSASTLTPYVQQWLQNPKAITVLHLFDEVINLINADGEIISVVQPKILPGPFSIVVDEKRPFPTLLNAYPQAAKTETVLKIGPLAIDCKPAELWNPRPNWDQLNQEHHDFQDCASQIQSTVEKQFELMGEIGLPNFTEKFQAAMAEMQTIRFEQNPMAWQTAVTKLAGFGPGFTPAGDDFLVGFLFGLWATRPQDEVEQLAKIVVETAVPRTTKLSAAWLQAAGRGEAWQSWHWLFDAIMDGYGWQLPFKVISERGATSGIAALLGFATAVSNNPA